MRISPEDHARVTQAVIDAERATDGELVTIVAERSDRYHDVALHWAVLAMLLPLAVLAVRPDWLLAMLAWLFGGWRAAPGLQEIITALLVVATSTFLATLLLMRYAPLRDLLTPPMTKTRRVRRRAIDLFKAGTDRRTLRRTGVLLYISLAERRAEIVADTSLHDKVAPAIWARAMAELIDHVRAGHPSEGIATAVTRLGEILAEHLPRSAEDTNELPDRLISL